MMELSILIIILLVLLVALVFGVNMLFRLLTERVPYVPSNNESIQLLLQNLELKEHAIVYDLGCGDARVLAAVKKKFPTITAIGYERAWWPRTLGWILYKRSGVTIRGQDFFTADLQDADTVFCYLLPVAMKKLSLVLRSMVRPGTTIIAHDFPLPDWTPTKIVRSKATTKSKATLYFYQA